MKRFLKLFFASAIPFALVMFAIALSYNPWQRALPLALIFALLFGASFAQLLTFIVYRRQKKNLEKPDSIVQQRRYHCALDAETLMAQLKENLTTRLDGRIVRQSGSDSLHATVGPSGKSLGEIIDIEITRHNGALQVTLCSKPKELIALVDFGKNRANIEQLIGDIPLTPVEEESPK
ncbi:MAG: hypothetical protein IMY82_04455 [Chloroflexi bacterium]|nr:hypothetical protein [Chloroflexota bacterium]